MSGVEKSAQFGDHKAGDAPPQMAGCVVRKKALATERDMEKEVVEMAGQVTLVTIPTPSSILTNDTNAGEQSKDRNAQSEGGPRVSFDISGSRETRNQILETQGEPSLKGLQSRFDQPKGASVEATSVSGSPKKAAKSPSMLSRKWMRGICGAQKSSVAETNHSSAPFQADKIGTRGSVMEKVSLFDRGVERKKANVSPRIGDSRKAIEEYHKKLLCPVKSVAPPKKQTSVETRTNAKVLQTELNKAVLKPQLPPRKKCRQFGDDPNSPAAYTPLNQPFKTSEISKVKKPAGAAVVDGQQPAKQCNFDLYGSKISKRDNKVLEFPKRNQTVKSPIITKSNQPKPQWDVSPETGTSPVLLSEPRPEAESTFMLPPKRAHPTKRFRKNKSSKGKKLSECPSSTLQSSDQSALIFSKKPADIDDEDSTFIEDIKKCLQVLHEQIQEDLDEEHSSSDEAGDNNARRLFRALNQSINPGCEMRSNDEQNGPLLTTKAFIISGKDNVEQNTSRNIAYGSAVNYAKIFSNIMPHSQMPVARSFAEQRDLFFNYEQISSPKSESETLILTEVTTNNSSMNKPSNQSRSPRKIETPEQRTSTLLLEDGHPRLPLYPTSSLSQSLVKEKIAVFEQSGSNECLGMVSRDSLGSIRTSNSPPVCSQTSVVKKAIERITQSFQKAPPKPQESKIDLNLFKPISQILPKAQLDGGKMSESASSIDKYSNDVNAFSEFMRKPISVFPCHVDFGSKCSGPSRPPPFFGYSKHPELVAYTPNDRFKRSTSPSFAAAAKIDLKSKIKSFKTKEVLNRNRMEPSKLKGVFTSVNSNAAKAKPTYDLAWSKAVAKDLSTEKAEKKVVEKRMSEKEEPIEDGNISDNLSSIESKTSKLEIASNSCPSVASLRGFKMQSSDETVGFNNANQALNVHLKTLGRDDGNAIIVPNSVFVDTEENEKRTVGSLNKNEETLSKTGVSVENSNEQDTSISLPNMDKMIIVLRTAKSTDPNAPDSNTSSEQEKKTVSKSSPNVSTDFQNFKSVKYHTDLCSLLGSTVGDFKILPIPEKSTESNSTAGCGESTSTEPLSDRLPKTASDLIDFKAVDVIKDSCGSLDKLNAADGGTDKNIVTKASSNIDVNATSAVVEVKVSETLINLEKPSTSEASVSKQERKEPSVKSLDISKRLAAVEVKQICDSFRSLDFKPNPDIANVQPMLQVVPEQIDFVAPAMDTIDSDDGYHCAEVNKKKLPLNNTADLFIASDCYLGGVTQDRNSVLNAEPTYMADIIPYSVENVNASPGTNDLYYWGASLQNNMPSATPIFYPRQNPYQEPDDGYSADVNDRTYYSWRNASSYYQTGSQLPLSVIQLDTKTLNYMKGIENISRKVAFAYIVHFAVFSDKTALGKAIKMSVDPESKCSLWRMLIATKKAKHVLLPNCYETSEESLSNMKASLESDISFSLSPSRVKALQVRQKSQLQEGIRNLECNLAEGLTGILENDHLKVANLIKFHINELLDKIAQLDLKEYHLSFADMQMDDDVLSCKAKLSSASNGNGNVDLCNSERFLSREKLDQVIREQVVEVESNTRFDITATTAFGPTPYLPMGDHADSNGFSNYDVIFKIILSIYIKTVILETFRAIMKKL